MGETTTMTMVMDPPMIHEFMMNVGVKKAHLKLYKMVLMGVMSGFYVMIGAHGMISLLAGSETNSTAMTLLAGLVFALALIGIIMVGGELFTGNCLLVVAVMAKRIRWWEMVMDLIIIFFANFAGNIIFSVLIFATGYYGWGFDTEDGQTAHAKTLCALVHKKTHPPAFQLFFRAIFANFCVCLAVLLSWSASSASGKVISMVWPIAVFVVSGWEHCIANQGLFALATLVNCPTAQGWYWVNLSMTTPGNICGAFIIGVTYFFITLWGTDKTLKKHPIYADDGVTICDFCKAPCCATNANASFRHVPTPEMNNESTRPEGGVTSIINFAAGHTRHHQRISFTHGTFLVDRAATPDRAYHNEDKEGHRGIAACECCAKQLKSQHMPTNCLHPISVTPTAEREPAINNPYGHDNELPRTATVAFLPESEQ